MAGKKTKVGRATTTTRTTTTARKTTKKKKKRIFTTTKLEQQQNYDNTKQATTKNAQQQQKTRKKKSNNSKQLAWKPVEFETPELLAMFQAEGGVMIEEIDGDGIDVVIFFVVYYHWFNT